MTLRSGCNQLSTIFIYIWVNYQDWYLHLPPNGYFFTFPFRVFTLTLQHKNFHEVWLGKFHCIVSYRIVPYCIKYVNEWTRHAGIDVDLLNVGNAVWFVSNLNLLNCQLTKCSENIIIILFHLRSSSNTVWDNTDANLEQFELSHL